jgi:hypothetical protein
LDSDGRADMAIVCNGNNKVSVFRNISAPIINDFTQNGMLVARLPSQDIISGLLLQKMLFYLVLQEPM